MLFSLFYSVQQPGSYWWHAHAGGQYSDGLLGALVLHSPNETYTLANSTATTSSTNTTYDGDLVIPVSDIWHSVSAQWLATYFQPGNADGTFEGAEPVPDSGLVAGYGRGTCDGLPAGTPCDGGQYFNYTLEPNKRYRLRIINVGSILSREAFIDVTVYTASKHAVLGMIKAGAKSLMEHNITVNGYAPGVVVTPLWEQLDKDLVDIGFKKREGQAYEDIVRDALQIKRVSYPEDITGTASFLASNDSDYMTGQMIHIDGGWCIQ